MAMTGEAASTALLDICGLAPVVPVLVIEDPASITGLGTALVAGGLPVLEITLRTEGALEAIRLASEISGAVVGAGTLLTAEDVENAKAAGASFGVSPGATDALIAAAEAADLPLLAGAATASEMMGLLERGYRVQKFFPAEASGGAKALGSFASPLSAIQFCPTGGVSPENAAEYLALPNVTCVGGSWVAPKGLVADQDWAGVTALARTAAALG